MSVRILGVRHHGPGSARAVVRALDEQQPEVVLIEGPPEADALVELAADPDLRPPVALHAYAVDEPGLSSFWPFAVFSPEWQAICWAVRRGVPVQFCDLPAATVLAQAAEERRRHAEANRDEEPSESEQEPTDQDSSEDEFSLPGEDSGGSVAPGDAELHPASSAQLLREDPIALLARAAGHDDPEAWWEDVMELRSDGDPFEVVCEAMAELRADDSGRNALPRRDSEETRIEEQREAYMRKVLRAATKKYQSVAVVCGAWHAPALSGKRPTVSADNAVLKGIPKRRIAITWVPWTHSRLSWRSGYGAGVDSPGWYHHLFTQPEDTITRWMTRAAAVLRDKDLPVSSAHVIEAVRLADTLAALRGRPLAGLDEVNDACESALCEGNAMAAEVIRREVIVGEQLGGVPDSAPGVPLEADLRQRARTLRLKQAAEPKQLTLDLRKELDRDRSQFLQQLNILGIGWGQELHTSGTGTFSEGWLLEWDPGFSVSVVEASLWGTTVPQAAGARLLHGLDSLDRVTSALEQALRSGVNEVVPTLLETLDARAAADVDVEHLMAALPPLIRAQRYGDVRGSDLGVLARVCQGLLMRICAGLGSAAGGLGAEGSARLAELVDQVNRSLVLLDFPAGRQQWQEVLLQVSERRDVNGLLAGRIVRILTDAGRIDPDEAADRLSLALSHAIPALEKAGWVEGFLAGDALLLIHDAALLSILDRWITSLGADEFVDVVAVLRRTFGSYQPAERRNLADAARRLGRTPKEAELPSGPDLELAAPVLATVRELLGV